MRTATLRLRPGKAILLVAAMTAVTCVAGLGSAAASAQASSWPAHVAHPAASCPRGQTLVAPTSGWTDALGVAHFRYESAPGLVTTVAPRGLTPSRVTPALAADLGLPAHAGSRQRLARQAVSLGASPTAQAFCRAAALPDKLRAPRLPTGSPEQNTHTNSTNWAGYEVTEAEHGGGMNGVDGSFTVGQSSTSSAPSQEDTWVGVGGGGAEGSGTWGLIQDGVEMRTNYGYRPWWEYIGSNGCCNAIYNSVNSARPGDSVTAEVWWNSSSSACFYLTDWTRSSGDVSACKSGLPIPYDHTSTEWINESHYPGDYYDNPGTIHFTDQALDNSFGGGGSWTSPFSGSFQADILVTSLSTTGTNCSDGAVVSYPAGAATSSSGGSSSIITCSVPGVDSP